PEDHEVIYRVHRDGWERSICVGKGGRSWLLPAFRWSELLKLSNVTISGHGAALLLLLPSTWLTQEDDRAQVRNQLLSSLEDLQLPHSDEPLVEQMVIDLQSETNWIENGQLGWINNEDNSRRNPKSRACLTQQEFSEVRNFLMAISNR